MHTHIPFSVRLGELLALPAEYFGCPSDWISFKGMGTLSSSSGWDVHEPPPAHDVVPDTQDDETQFVVPEIGHLQNLRDYYQLDIDRRPEILKQWIDDLADGSPLSDGYFTVDVPHYQAHGIPGRFLPRHYGYVYIYIYICTCVDKLMHRI